MQERKKIVAVFGAYRPRAGEPEYETACEIGRQIALAGWVVMNGGYSGTMEASARGAKEAGGHVVGITAEIFSRAPNRFTDETQCARDLWERLRLLVERADAFVVLPGATGTLAEIGVAWEFLCKKFMPPKPLVFLGDFWLPLYNLMVSAPESRAACHGLACIASSPRDAVDRIASILGQ